MPISSLPTPPSRADSATFADRADAWNAALVGFTTSANTLQNEVNAKEVTAVAGAATATAQAIAAAASASAASANANMAVSASGAARWVSGTTYALGFVVWSPINSRTYRRTVAGAGTTDPSLDAANWALLTLDIDTGYPAIRPSLNLDFANSQSVDPRITFTRASTATRTNARGLIETVGSGVPRIDFDPVTGECKGLLVEEPRTNLLTYSEVFSDVSWLKNDTSVSANSTSAPDGALTADTLVESTANVAHSFTKAVTFTAASTLAVSVFVKQAPGAARHLRIQMGSTSGFRAYFDLSTGTVAIAEQSYGTGTAVSGSAAIASVGNGWYRCSVAGTVDSSLTTETQTFFLQSTTTGSAAYTGDGASGLFIWGVQVEVGAFPTSYIPTVASQVTRAPDIAVMTGVNFSSWYRNDEGSFVVKAINTLSPASNFPSTLRVTEATGTSQFSFSTTNIAGILYSYANVMVASVTQADLSSFNPTTVIMPGVPYTRAFGYKTNEFAMSPNGSAALTDSTGSLPTVDRLTIGSSHSGGSILCGHLQRITYYPKRLTNAQLQTLSAL